MLTLSPIFAKNFSMADRNTYIGSTESVALVEPESSPFCSAMSIFLEKSGLVERAKATERMNTGKYLERAILDEWNRRNDRAFVFNSEPAFYDDAKRIGATVDGICGAEGVEVKTVTQFRRADWNNGTPRYIWWQCQHEMLCARLQRIAVIAQFGFDELSYEWVEADNEAQGRIVEACSIMWDRIDGKLPPPDADGSDATTEALARRELTAKAIELGPDIREMSDDLAGIERLQREFAAEQQRLRNLIRSAMGDASVGIWPDGTGWKVRQQPATEFMVKKKAHTVMARILNKESVENDE